jgi:hypothetical protein
MKDEKIRQKLKQSPYHEESHLEPAERLRSELAGKVYDLTHSSIPWSLLAWCVLCFIGHFMAEHESLITVSVIIVCGWSIIPIYLFLRLWRLSRRLREHIIEDMRRQ